MDFLIPEERSESTDLLKFKRQEFAIEIRKKKTEEIINHKRTKLIMLKPTQTSDDHNTINSAKKLSEQFIDSVASRNIDSAKLAVEKIRISLCTAAINSEPYILEYMESGVVKVLIMLLDQTYECYSQFQEDVSWALCNIISTSDQYVVYAVKNGIVEKLLAAVEFAKDNFLERCLWIIANLVSESIEIRNEFLRNDLTKKLVKILAQCQRDEEKVKTVTWLLSKLAHGKPFPPLDMFTDSLTLLGELMLNTSNDKIIEDILWCFYYISEGGETARISAVCDLGVLPKTINLLSKTKNERIATLAFRLCGNIAMCDSYNTEILFHYGFLDILTKHLEHRKKHKRKEACWVVGNLVAEKKLIGHILESSVFTKVFHLIQMDQPDIRTDATFIVKNALDNLSYEELEIFVKKGIMEMIIRNMDMQYPIDLIDISLDTLRKILERGAAQAELEGHRINLFTHRVFETKGNVTLEELQKHKNPDIFAKFCRLLDDFFAYDVVK